MTLVNHIPKITSQASLRIQRAVHEAGQDIEFRAIQKAGRRRRSGKEQTGIKWKPDKGGFSGVVQASTFYTGFSEEGTTHQPANPILKNSAAEVEPDFLRDIAMAYRL